MNKKVSQSQRVVVKSEAHGTVFEDLCPFAKNRDGFGSVYGLTKMRKAILYIGEITRVICESYNPENKKCQESSNNLPNKSCIFI